MIIECTYIFVIFIFLAYFCEMGSSPDRYYIPDNELKAPEIILRHTRTLEIHYVTSPQGYILTIFRIPHKSPKGIIYFQHGLAQDGGVWVSQYNQSIAFLFWNAGYDIWLGNARGSDYSKNHVTFNSDQWEFWNFSFHEIGYYDFGAIFKYMKMKTNKSKIIYLGFSMGATSALVYASLLPEDAANFVEIMVLIAPVCYAHFATSPLTPLVLKPIDFVYKHNLNGLVKWHSFAGHDTLLLKLFRTLRHFFLNKYVCAYFLDFFMGQRQNTNGIDPNLIDIMFDHFGSSTSLKHSSHIYQITQRKETFRRYDYGKKNNLKMYGREEPPPYPLDNIKTPIFIIHGENDIVSHPQDVEFLYQKLPSTVKIGKKMVAGFNHVDFQFGKDRNEKVYNEILQIIDILALSNDRH